MMKPRKTTKKEQKRECAEDRNVCDYSVVSYCDCCGCRDYYYSCC